MYRYAAYGLEIASEFEFPELAEGSGEPEVRICVGKLPPHSKVVTLHEDFAFPHGIGRFLVRGGSEIFVDPAPDGDLTLLRAMLLGRAMSYLMRQRGWLPLHASGIEIEGRAALFLAASGGGKSTTAAGFARCGYRVITDDIGPVRENGDRLEVCPSWPHLRLTDDSRRLLQGNEPAGTFGADKHVYRFPDGIRRSLPVARVFLLEDGSSLKTETLSPLDAVAALSANTFPSTRPAEPAVFADHIRTCVRLAKLQTVTRLIRPRNLDQIGELVEWVAEDVRKN